MISINFRQKPFFDKSVLKSVIWFFHIIGSTSLQEGRAHHNFTGQVAHFSFLFLARDTFYVPLRRAVKYDEN